jgi:PHD/YefM family antitoxin component YafN of YafNO toxin-antitoxin module
MAFGNYSATAVELSSTDAKNNFANLLEQVLKGQLVAVTRYKKRKMACIPWEDYVQLIKSTEVSLDKLTGEFDELRLRISSEKTAKAAQSLMDATDQDFAHVKQD